MKSKPVSDFFVSGKFTEDKEVLRGTEETNEEELCFSRGKDQQFTKDGSGDHNRFGFAGPCKNVR